MRIGAPVQFAGAGQAVQLLIGQGSQRAAQDAGQRNAVARVVGGAQEI